MRPFATPMRMDTPEQKLQQFRDRIDAVDEQLARLLIERIGIIREVARLKAANWPKACHIRPGREGQMHHAIARRFAGTGFPPLMALAMWRQMIGGSTHVESPLNITYLDAHPEHQFLGREYFGVQIGATRAATLAEGVATLEAKQSNILILPDPHCSDWWKDTQTLQQAGLFIFAQLPVVHDTLPEGATRAVALAAITPEDSGNDVSYFVSNQGGTPHLEIIAGFKNAREGAIFLGAHPDAVHLSEGVLYA